MRPFASAQRIHFGILGIPFVRGVPSTALRAVKRYGFIAATALSRLRLHVANRGV